VYVYACTRDVTHAPYTREKEEKRKSGCRTVASAPHDYALSPCCLLRGVLLVFARALRAVRVCVSTARPATVQFDAVSRPRDAVAFAGAAAGAAADAAGQRAELELLMADGPEGVGRTAHFDKRELKAQAKLASKGKRKGKRALRGSPGQTPAEDGFKMDVSDPRFKAIYEKSEFAVDPSHPRFDKTQGMVAVLEESRRKRQRTAEEY